MSDVATDLLTAASSLLRRDGAGALSVRRVAESAGCSTMAIYSRFGGKAGLLDALAREGFIRLSEAVDAAQAGSGGGPRAELLAMCAAMRETALADPLRYRLMFGPISEPSAETREAARRSLDAIDEAVTRASSSGAIEVTDTRAAAETVWALCHGLIGVELAGALGGDGAARLARGIGAVLAGFETPPA